jgi:prepilin-type N-terminal cleavage/methylation domain-containing protein
MMRRHYLAGKEGFTLVEMIVVMAIFIVVIFITTKAFETAIVQTKKVFQREESNIEGVIGLEMLRHDLEQAGFGLFTAVDTLAPPVYSEATGTRPATYNDSNNSSSGIPRGVVAGNDITDGTVLSGTDYLAIKATTVARNKTSQKWTYISGVGSARDWGGVDELSTSDYIIAVEQKVVSGELQRKLIYDTADPSSFSVTYKTTASSYSDPFGPPSDAKLYHYYGIDDINPLTPFNRTDYFVQRSSSTPSNCAPGAGVLYKTVMSQTDGSMSDIIPILDCVADMQIVFEWDAALFGSADTYSNADATTYSTKDGFASSPWAPTPSILTGANASLEIRKHLRLIKVYILAQDGGKDTTFVNKNTAMRVGSDLDSALVSKTINLTQANYQNYRWKLYRIVVKPKNIIQIPLVP